MKFSARSIDTFEIRDKEYQVREIHGFTLRVMPATVRRPAGGKRWEYVYDSPTTGKRRRMSLGTYPDVSLKAAHKLHADARALLLQGIDPQDPVSSEPDPLPELSEGITVEELKKRYIKHITGGVNENGEILHGLSPRSVNNQSNRMEKYLIPAWKDRIIKELKKADAIKLLESIEKPGAARNILLAARAMFAYALDRELVEFNPFARAGKSVPKTAPNERERVLDHEEIMHVHSLLKSKGKSSVIQRALLTILYTGQRPDEVAGMPKSEIDKTLKWWTIPKERAKNNQEHRVYLSLPVRKLIAPLLLLPGDYVFPAGRGAKGPTLVTSLDSHVQRYMGVGNYAGLPRWTPHDLRRTYATGLASLGADDATIDVMQNHKKKGVVRIYNRYKYDPQRRKWAIKWAWEIRRILRTTP